MKTTRYRTLDDAYRSHPLARAVLIQAGGGGDAIRTALEAAEHGANAGFPGFIYYGETCDFTKAFRDTIAKAVESVASETGQETISFVRGFRCVNDDISGRAIGAALWASRDRWARSNVDKDDLMLVENALAWFALEEVGHALEADGWTLDEAEKLED